MGGMDPTDLLGALVRGAFASKRRKRSTKALRFLTNRHPGSFLNASTMLTAAGLAWGAYETWQRSSDQQSAAGAPPSAGHVPTTAGALPTAPPPLPHAGAAPSDPGMPQAVLRMVRLIVSAARADGNLGERELAAIVEHARGAGTKTLVHRELAETPSLAEIVAGVTDPQEKAELYTLAFAIIRADEQVTGAERIYLAQLASLLGLDAAAATRIELETASRIDSQDHSAAD